MVASAVTALTLATDREIIALKACVVGNNRKNVSLVLYESDWLFLGFKSRIKAANRNESENIVAHMIM